LLRGFFFALKPPLKRKIFNFQQIITAINKFSQFYRCTRPIPGGILVM